LNRKIFSVLFALVLVLSFSLVTAVPAGAVVSGAPTIDGLISTGEWDGAVEIDVAEEMGTVKLLASTDYLYMLFVGNDPTDAREGENTYGNDKLSININPTDGGDWGKPYDIVFQTGADPDAFTTPNPDIEGSSGNTDNWKTEWVVEGVQLDLPEDLETKTIYNGGTRISEWQVPLATIAPTMGDTLLVGGNCDNLGDTGNGYKFPPTLDWAVASTYVEYWYGVNNQDTGLYYQTIQAAIDAASGTTLVCAPGIYNEDVTIDKSLTLISAAGKDNTIISGQAGAQAAAVDVADGVSNVVIGDIDQGFTINAAGLAAIRLVGSGIGNQGITIRDNRLVASGEIATNSRTALSTGGLQSNHTIADNEFSGDANQLVYVNGQASLGLPSTAVNFINNTFSGTATGPALGQEAADSTISGNTFATVTGYASLELWGDHISSPTIGANNIVTGNYFTADLPAGGLYLVDNPGMFDISGTLDIDAVLANNSFLRAVVVENPGSSRLPKIWANIQDAVNEAVSGDTVDVIAGQYSENVVIPPDKDGLQLLGAGSDDTIISVSSGNAIEVSSPVIIKGFHILQTGVGHAINMVGVVSGTSDHPGVIQANKIECLSGSTGRGILFYGSSNAYWEFKGNDFTDCRTGIYFGKNTKHILVSGNTFSGYLAACGGTESTDYITITGNQFLGGDVPDCEGIGIATSASNLTIEHNTITGNYNGIKVWGLTEISTVHVNYNNISGNTNYGIEGSSSVVATLDALYNYWGNETGPEHTTLNTGAQGDAVSNNVDFSPWLYETQENFVFDAPCYAGSVVLGKEASVVVVEETSSWKGGWNSFSTPVTLDGKADTVSGLLDLVKESGLSIERAQRFDPIEQIWVTLVMGTVIDEAYEIKPGEGFFIQVSTEGSLPILCLTTLTTSPPMTNLVAGWNLVGLSNFTWMPVVDALHNVDYSVVISPSPPNAVPWSLPSLDDRKSMEVGEAYWLGMGQPGILFGRTTTPVADNLTWDLNHEIGPR